jgi:branched-subunit amino acid ABC-type transport system permease component
MQILINIIFSASVYLLIASSFLIIYNVAKFFYIAHAIAITLAAYFTFFFSEQITLPLLFSIPFAILLTISIGLFTELIVYRPLRNRKGHSLFLLIASLGVYVVLQNIISLIWGDATLSIRIREIAVGHQIFSAYITTIQIVTISISIIVLILSYVFYRFTQLGKKLRAVSSNNELAKVFGINSDKVILWAFALGSCIAAIVGILVAFDTDMRPTMGFNLLLYGVVAMIIGGVGSTWGLVGGAYLLATAQHLGAYYIDSKWMDAIAYVILIIFLIWKPLGFSGRQLKKTEI